ncbi:MAG: hypothetical protein ACFFAU_03800 [Candidatus Hodarchaeota archaeon]
MKIALPILFIPLILTPLFISTVFQLAAAPWSQSSINFTDFDYDTLGNSRGFKDNGHIGDYKTWFT